MRFRSRPESHDAFATGVKTGPYFHMIFTLGGWEVGRGWVGRVHVHANCINRHAHFAWICGVGLGGAC